MYHKEPIPYDMKEDLPFEKENAEWPVEKVEEPQWEKNELDKETVEIKEEKKSPLKYVSEKDDSFGVCYL